MAHRNSTLRKMSPTARKVARLNGELESVARRIANVVPTIQQIELDSEALKQHKCNQNVVAAIFITNCDCEDVPWQGIVNLINDGYYSGIDMPLGINWHLATEF